MIGRVDRKLTRMMMIPNLEADASDFSLSLVTCYLHYRFGRKTNLNFPVLASIFLKQLPYYFFKCAHILAWTFYRNTRWRDIKYLLPRDSTRTPLLKNFKVINIRGDHIKLEMYFFDSLFPVCFNWLSQFHKLDIHMLS